jgi:RHS repeat-associated protein
LTNEVRYVYDGNLVIQERGTNNMPLVSYTRGSDLSGSLQLAGGIGGLLARTDHHLLSIGDPSAHAFYHADGNGNITLLINQSQATVAKYIYDAFGNIISQCGSLADANLYRFSSKELHAPSGLVYYLYRFYDPNLQRWINRDPLGDWAMLAIYYPRIGRLLSFKPAEQWEGVDLFAFVKNGPVNRWDSLGLLSKEDSISGCRTKRMLEKAGADLAAGACGFGMGLACGAACATTGLAAPVCLALCGSGSAAACTLLGAYLDGLADDAYDDCLKGCCPSKSPGHNKRGSNPHPL